MATMANVDWYFHYNTPHSTSQERLRFPNLRVVFPLSHSPAAAAGGTPISKVAYTSGCSGMVKTFQ